MSGGRFTSRAALLAAALISLTCVMPSAERSFSRAPLPMATTTPGALHLDETHTLGPEPIRRLTHGEYDATIRDLLGDDSKPSKRFAPDVDTRDFDNRADALTVTPLLAEHYAEAAEQLAKSALERDPGLIGCAPIDIEGELRCAENFIESFGKRAFRRPLDVATVASYLDVFREERATTNFVAGIERVLETMLQSPRFLYRIEEGPIDDFARASRLSYLLWGTMPDEALFGAAEAGKLHTTEEVAKAADRMLADPRARERVARFSAQWLELDAVLETNKVEAVYPGWDADLRMRLRHEAALLVDDVFWNDGRFSQLLLADYTFVDSTLARFYGLPRPLPGKELDALGFHRLTIDPSRRLGILGLGAFLAAQAHPDQSAPVRRGKFIRERLLCQPLDPPPDDVVATPPKIDPRSTTRARLELHEFDPRCATCHDKIDPLGFALEHFDGVGRFRLLESKHPIDATGTLTFAKPGGDFDGEPALSRLLAESDDARSCYVKQWFRFAFGRRELSQDDATLRELSRRFAEHGYDVRVLPRAIAESVAFRLEGRLEGKLEGKLEDAP